MLGIVIQAAILVGLIRIILEEDGNWLISALVAVGVSVATWMMAFGLAGGLGLDPILSILVAAVTAGAGLGVGLAFFYGAGFARAFLVAGIYMAVTIGLSLLI